MEMKDSEIITNLKKIVDTAGVDAFANHPRANALISDYFAGNDNVKIRRLIKSIIDVDAFTKLSRAGNGDLDSVCKALMNILVDQESLSEDRAEMALGWVCGALGKRKPDFPKPVPAPAPAPTPAKPKTPSYSASSSAVSSAPSSVSPSASPKASSVSNPSSSQSSTSNTYGINVNYHVKKKSSPFFSKKAKKTIVTLVVLAVVGAALYFGGSKLVGNLKQKAAERKAQEEYENSEASSYYTPEILQSFVDNTGKSMLTFLTCDENGNVTAKWECLSENGYYLIEMEGQITSKKNSGDLEITWGKQIVHDEAFPYLNWTDEKLTRITNNYATVQTDARTFTPGSVAEIDDLVLNTPADLQKLSGGKYWYTLGSDIDFKGAEITPISGFKGTLIGGGHTIKNVTINQQKDNVGFFDVLEGTVTDVTFENVSVSTVGRTERAGILCGTLKGSVSNIRMVGCVLNAENSNYVGSIAGYVSAIPRKASLSGLESDTIVSGRDYVGGLFGRLAPSCRDEGDNATLMNCLNYGAVTGENFVGGLLGSLYFTGSHAIVHYSYPVYLLSVANEGPVTGKTYVGGIVGSGDADTSESYIKDSYCKADISAEAMAGCIGGSCNLTIDNCSNEGSTLIANGFIMDNGEMLAYVGGYVGKGAIVKNCTNTVTVSNTGGKYVAGIIGYSANYPNKAVISNLINKANITGSDCTGGIFGRVSPESNGKGDSLAINNVKNEGVITGNDCVGGVLGYLYLDGSHAIVHYDFPAYFTALENTGKIIGHNNVGGIIGYGRTDTEISELIGSSSVQDVIGNSDVGQLIGKAENITVRP